MADDELGEDLCVVCLHGDEHLGSCYFSVD